MRNKTSFTNLTAKMTVSENSKLNNKRCGLEVARKPHLGERNQFPLVKFHAVNKYAC